MARYTVRFAGSAERIPAPTNYSEEEAARWALRHYHPTADRRMKQLAPGVWSGSNGRRGPDKRGTVLMVEAEEA
jgi:hypothetical protein